VNHTNLETLFNPKTVCVIGASQKRNKVGSQVLVNLITASFTGKIYPINPKHDMLFGLKTYKSIKDIVESIDLAVVTIPNSQVPSVIEECVEENVKFAVIITAGFGEMEAYDPGGVTLRTELLQILKRGSLRVVGPNCMGLVSTSSNLLALMGFGIPPARKKINASIVSQSGTWGITTIRAGTVQGLGFSKFVSSGNELDLKFEDYLEYFGADPDTQIILGFIEGLRQGKRFIKVVKEIDKPILLIKGGKTQSGKVTAKSHTGSLAGSHQLYEAIFKQYGIIEVNNMNELVDFGRAFARCLSYDPPKFPKGNRVGLFSGGGGFCVLMADNVELEGLTLAQLSPETIEQLNKILPPYWSHRNPVDLVASWDFKSYTKVLKILLKDPNIDAVIARPPLGFSLIYENEDVIQFIKQNPQSVVAMPHDMVKSFDLSIVREMGRIAKRSTKPIIVPLGFYTAEAPKQYEIIRELDDRGILIAPSGQQAARILKKLWDFYKYQEKKKGDKNR